MDLAKLSRLQQWILYAAYDNRSAAVDGTGADLYYHEVLFSYFGFPMLWHTDEPLHSHPGAHRFDREAIGRARYGAAQASVSRAVRRLEALGLAERYVPPAGRWAGLRLTDTAIEAAGLVACRATQADVTVGSMSAQPDGEPYEVIHLGGEAAAIVPLGELRRLQAVERYASPEALEEADIEATLAAHDEAR